MTRGVLTRGLWPVAIFIVLTAVMTWPQVTVLGTEATNHPDVYFNMWRFGWFGNRYFWTSFAVFKSNAKIPA